jgi:manganese transport protein
LRAEGFAVDAVLAMGEPSDEIIRFVRENEVDLIAMSTHGHRFLSDLIHGSTADKVRHLVGVPVLLLKARR